MYIYFPSHLTTPHPSPPSTFLYIIFSSLCKLRCKIKPASTINPGGVLWLIFEELPRTSHEQMLFVSHVVCSSQLLLRRYSLSDELSRLKQITETCSPTYPSDQPPTWYRRITPFPPPPPHTPQPAPFSLPSIEVFCHLGRLWWNDGGLDGLGRSGTRNVIHILVWSGQIWRQRRSANNRQHSEEKSINGVWILEKGQKGKNTFSPTTKDFFF